MLKTMRYLKIFCITGTIFFTLGYPIAVFSAEYPKSRGYVSDFAGVIDQQSAEMIVRIATEVEQKTSAQIAVVTITSLEGESLEYYANELFSQWKIGQKGKDNGALILLAAKERQVRIETGYGLEGIIPDGKAGDIIRESMLPYFKQGAIGKGMLSGTITIGSIIAEDAGVSISGNVRTMVGRSRGRRRRSPFSRLIGIIFFILMIPIMIRHPFLFLLLMSGGRGGFGGGGFSRGSGGFGGFGGGFSGGGGASGSW